ncbi:MAG TPA: aquaporin [Thermoanaerobaculia bacterium]|nr:aquaporin [Thermoanaerobaculia bacterium]
MDHATGALGHGGVAASFGLVIMVMIAALGHLSGAHFNPAVTLAFAVTRHFSWRDVPPYLLGQLLGAVGGALTLRAFFGLDAAALGATAPVGSPLRALGIEVLLTLSSCSSSFRSPRIPGRWASLRPSRSGARSRWTRSGAGPSRELR